ncbi:MAG: hypothetical protein ABH816_01470 [Candidatus Levyibacteriota bacterium]
MDKVCDYLQELYVNFPRYVLSAEDKKVIEHLGKAEWITQKLILGKFRKAKISQNSRQDIFDKVSLSLKENKPLYLIICFGGYKHFWNPSHPQIDFAEFFNLRFMSEYFAPILVVHPPGVILDYESEDVILPMMNNYPESALDEYAQSFRELIKLYTQNIPKNFKINYVRSQEQYDTSKVFKRITELMPKKRKEWKKLSKEEREKRLHKAANSIMWKGKEDLTGLNEKEKRKKI